MNDYTLMSKLGEGAFSVVYKVKRRQDGQEYAMKKMRIMSLSQKQISNCLNEVRILASIEDPFILSYRDSFFDELTNTFCIITEFLEGGDIFHLINKHKANKKLIEQETIWRVAAQILKGLSTLHRMNILHRDIKSANIFLTKDHKVAKLGDMNVSIVSSNGMAKTQTGTPYYASPQVWNQKPYSSKCDIWSLGCVLYEMAAQKPPFVSLDLKSLKKTIISGVYKRIPSQYSNDLQNFIRSCLKVDPRERSSANDLLADQFIRSKLTCEDIIQQSTSRRLLQKIQPPRRREFKIIKERLPMNKFSSSVEKADKSLINRSTVISQKEKENIYNFENTGKITKKDAPLPTIKRSCSSTNESKLKALLQPQLPLKNAISNDEKPPLPKKMLRA